MSPEPRYLIVTPTQYHQGWAERRGDVVVWHPFRVHDRLADGNYVVLDPALKITLALTATHLEAVLNCLDTCASDEREPERYRSWYAEAAAEIRRQSDGSAQ